MRTLRIRVTAEHIDAAEGLPPSSWWDAPVANAIGELLGEDVSIDGGGVEDHGEDVNVATIGQDTVTLVVDLPIEANRFLNARWERQERGEPFEFDLEVVPDWLERALGPDLHPADRWLTLAEAAEQLGVKPATLRQLANGGWNGNASPTAQRLRTVKVGRDWLVPAEGLAAEVAHRLRQLRSVREVVER